MVMNNHHHFFCYIDKFLYIYTMKTLKCTICNWTTEDILNKGGHPRRHLKEKHAIIVDKYDYKEYFVENIIEDKPIFKCPLCNDWTTVDVDNKSGWTTIHLETVHGLKSWEFYEQYPEYTHMWTYYGPREKLRHGIINGGSDNYVECLECGKKLLKLTNSHLKIHNITFNEYKRKHNVKTVTSNRLIKWHRDRYYANTKLLELQFESKAEIQLQEYAKLINVPCIPHYRIGYNELDLYLPDNDLGIEFDGLYYHSEISAGRTEKYHLNKTNIVENAGDRLIHIFEDEWGKSPEIVKSMISDYCNIYTTIIQSQFCVISECTEELAENFLNDNHIFGHCKSDHYIILLTNSNIVEIIGISYDNTSNIHILDRYCTKLFTNVIGGLDLILIYAASVYNIEKLIHYVDRRYITKYIEDNFEFIENTPPIYHYLDRGNRYMTRHNKSEFTLEKILEKFPDADPNLSEWENMKLLGYDRIWDCGSKKYIKTFN